MKNKTFVALKILMDGNQYTAFYDIVKVKAATLAEAMREVVEKSPMIGAPHRLSQKFVIEEVIAQQTIASYEDHRIKFLVVEVPETDVNPDNDFHGRTIGWDNFIGLELDPEMCANTYWAWGPEGNVVHLGDVWAYECYASMMWDKNSDSLTAQVFVRK